MKTKKLLLPLFLAVGLCPVVAITQDGKIPDKVDTLLKNMSDLLEEADEFAFSADVQFDEILGTGQSIQHGASVSAAVSRPGHLAAHYEGEENERFAWHGGETTTLYHKTREVYSVVETPPSNGEALDFLMEKYDLSLPLADFIIEGVHESLTSRIDRAFYVGKATINGHRCDHIASSQEYIDWQLWIDDGLLPLPRKVLITYKAVPGVPTYAAVFKMWNLDVELPDSIFEPKVPDEAVKIDLLEIERRPIPSN